MAEIDDAEREMARADYIAQIAEAAQFQQRQLTLVDRGLQSLMLINGGALIALFTLLGSKAQLHVDHRLLWASFTLFAAGLAATVVSNFAAFFAQGFYYQSTQHQAWNAQKRVHALPEAHDVQTPYKRGDIAEVVGIGAAIVALAGFIAGCAFAFAGVVPA